MGKYDENDGKCAEKRKSGEKRKRGRDENNEKCIIKEERKLG